MTKVPLSAYLDPKLVEALETYAARRKVSKSVVAEAAIASFLSPDSAERDEAVLARRFDRLSRQVERLERDSTISIEMLALFVRAWLAATPALPEPEPNAAESKARERFERFVRALGQRLASGRSLAREVSEDVTRTQEDQLARGGGQSERPARS